MSVSGCSCRVLIVLVMSVVGHSGRKVGNPVTISATPAQNQPAAAGNGGLSFVDSNSRGKDFDLI